MPGAIREPTPTGGPINKSQRVHNPSEISSRQITPEKMGSGEPIRKRRGSWEMVELGKLKITNSPGDERK